MWEEGKNVCERTGERGRVGDGGKGVRKLLEKEGRENGGPKGTSVEREILGMVYMEVNGGVIKDRMW